MHLHSLLTRQIQREKGTEVFRINITLKMKYNTSHGITLLLSEKGTTLLINVTCMELISDQVICNL